MGKVNGGNIMLMWALGLLLLSVIGLKVVDWYGHTHQWRIDVAAKIRTRWFTLFVVSVLLTAVLFAVEVVIPFVVNSL